jgi:hypothetical membrane protein
MGPGTIILSAWYFTAQVLVAWVFRPRYSFINNVISDLGNTACPPPHSDICSPRWAVMDVSIAFLGLAMMVGSMLIFTEFSFSNHRRERIVALFAFAFLGLGGLGAILVGVQPENINTAHLHTIGTALAIGFGQLAILMLGLVLREIPDWLREFMIVTSLFVLLAGVSIAFKHQFGFGAGALERIAQYPESIWLILFGFYISRDHYRRGLTGGYFRFTTSGRSTGRNAIAKALRESVQSQSQSGAQSIGSPRS